jgi:hypothetical protein
MTGPQPCSVVRCGIRPAIAEQLAVELFSFIQIIDLQDYSIEDGCLTLLTPLKRKLASYHLTFISAYLVSMASIDYLDRNVVANKFGTVLWFQLMS